MIRKFVNARLVKPLFSISKLGRNIIHGQADSGLNIDCMYRKRPQGISPVGTLVDSLLLNLPTVKMTRNKKGVLIKILQNEVSNNIILNKKTRIVDLASGPARYLVDLVDSKNRKNLEILCLDTDKRSVKYGKTIAGSKPIRYTKANIFSLGCLKKFAKKVGWVPNVIMVTGFFEMQSDEVVKNFLEEIYAFLESGGLVLFTGQAKNLSKDLMKDIGTTLDGKKWEMYLRQPEQYRRWMLDVGFRDVIISLDSLNMYEYCTGRKV